MFDLFERILTAVYWGSVAAIVLWLAWLLWGLSAWWVVLLCLPLIVLPVAVLGPALAVASAIVAAAVTGVVALIRAVRRRRAA